jgi:hypothetical protein
MKKAGVKYLMLLLFKSAFVERKNATPHRMPHCRMGVKFEHFDEFEAKLEQFVVRKLCMYCICL